jgi:hypothetical protein
VGHQFEMISQQFVWWHNSHVCQIWRFQLKNCIAL